MATEFGTMMGTIQGSTILADLTHLLRAKRIEALTNAMVAISDFTDMNHVRANIAHELVKATKAELL